ncbi:DUF992 domain-containing protein [Pseudaestuariivita sp.]|uniref:DUF992 domain-containing protein n=1 Tax=Pseudaestuariivita sp. TaxID=2211669 RepID=UPI004058C285
MTFARTISGAAAALIALPSAVIAESNGPDADKLKSEAVRLGKLECTVAGGFGLLLGSSKKADCRFIAEDGTERFYDGKLKKLGVDVGISDESFMSWVVYSPKDSAVSDDPITGEFVGFSADAALGIGLGANALIGSTQKNVGLQPLRIEGKKGLNLAVGMTSLELAPRAS